MKKGSESCMPLCNKIVQVCGEKGPKCEPLSFFMDLIRFEKSFRYSAKKKVQNSDHFAVKKVQHLDLQVFFMDHEKLIKLELYHL